MKNGTNRLKYMKYIFTWSKNMWNLLEIGTISHIKFIHIHINTQFYVYIWYVNKVAYIKKIYIVDTYGCYIKYNLFIKKII